MLICCRDIGIAFFVTIIINFQRTRVPLSTLVSPLAPPPSWLNLAIHQTQPVMETGFVSPSLVLQTSGSSYSRKMDASNSKRMRMNQTVAQKLIPTG